jgi:hypothetical protein
VTSWHGIGKAAASTCPFSRIITPPIYVLRDRACLRSDHAVTNLTDRGLTLFGTAPSVYLAVILRHDGTLSPRRNGGGDRCRPTHQRTRPAEASRIALQKPLQPSEELAAVVGPSPLSRGEVVSKIWGYIRSHNLQNPENRREILADDQLTKVFGQQQGRDQHRPGNGNAVCSGQGVRGPEAQHQPDNDNGQ